MTEVPNPNFPKATVREVRRIDGLLGAFQLDVTVEYDNGTRDYVTFVGSDYGTPGLVMLSSSGVEWTRVESPERFGDRLNAAWVRNFYAS